jgi:hypothetical protein
MRSIKFSEIRQGAQSPKALAGEGPAGALAAARIVDAAAPPRPAVLAAGSLSFRPADVGTEAQEPSDVPPGDAPPSPDAASTKPAGSERP